MGLQKEEPKDNNAAVQAQLLAMQDQLTQKEQQLIALQQQQQLEPLKAELTRLNQENEALRGGASPFNQAGLPPQVASGSPVALNTHAHNGASTTNVGVSNPTALNGPTRV